MVYHIKVIAGRTSDIDNLLAVKLQNNQQPSVQDGKVYEWMINLWKLSEFFISSIPLSIQKILAVGYPDVGGNLNM